MSVFSDRLNETMTRTSVSRAQLVELSGIKRASINRYCAGATFPAQAVICKLAEALCVDENYLSGGAFDHSADNSCFAGRLRAEMDKQRLNSPALAKLAGLSRSTLTKYLSGQNRPTHECVTKLAKALAVDSAYLAGDETFKSKKSKYIPLTEEEKDFITNNIGLAYSYVGRKGWPPDEWLDIAMLGFIYAARRYLANPAYAEIPFPRFASQHMRRYISAEYKNQAIRKGIETSLDAPLQNDEDGGTLLDVI